MGRMATASTASAASLRVLVDDDVALFPDDHDRWIRELEVGTATRTGLPAKPLTIRNYRKVGKSFYQFVQEKGISTDPADIEREHIIQYAEWMAARGYKPNTRRVWMTALKTFFTWLEVTDPAHPRSPYVGIRIPRPEDSHGAFPSDDEIRKLIKACAPPSDGEWLHAFTAYRDEAIMRVFLDTVCRQGALRSMCWEHVDLAGGLVLQYQKGSGNHWAWKRIESKTVKALKRYKRLWLEHPAVKAALAGKGSLTIKGGPMGEQVTPVWFSRFGPDLSEEGLRQTMRVRFKEAGVDWIKLHGWRHRGNDALRRKGKDGLSTEHQMAIGGWKSFRVFGGYAKSAEDERILEARDSISLGDKF